MIAPKPSKLAIAIRAARPLAHANIAPPLLLGQALAFRLEGSFSLSALAYVQLFGVIDHLFIVFANDYADRNTDTGRRTLVSGGSGVLVDGLMRPSTSRRAAMLAGGALLVLGLARGPVTLVFAVAAIALMLAYSYPPLRLSYRGHGEWLQGIGVGLVLPWLGYHVQSDSVLVPFGALAGTILLATASNVITAMPDLESDTHARKRTLPVRFGAERSAHLAGASTLLGILLLVFCAPLDERSRAVILTLSIAPLAFSMFRGPGDSPKAVIPWVIGMGASHQMALLGVTFALVFAPG